MGFHSKDNRLDFNLSVDDSIVDPDSSTIQTSNSSNNHNDYYGWSEGYTLVINQCAGMKIMSKKLKVIIESIIIVRIEVTEMGWNKKC